MKDIIKKLRLFITSYVAMAVGLWGFAGGYTYFTGDRLKEMLGSFWPLLFYGVPAVFSIIATIISLKKEDLEPNEKHDDNQYLKAFKKCEALDDLIATAITEIGDITRTDYNQILLANTEQHTANLLTVADIIPRHKQRYRVATYDGLLGTAFSESELLNIHNVNYEPRYFPAVPETKSELVIPIVNETATIGVINSESEELAYYDRHICEKMRQVANALGTILPVLGWSANMTKGIRHLKLLPKIDRE